MSAVPAGEHYPDVDARRYSLSGDEMQARVAELLLAQPPVTEKEIVCYRLESERMDDVARTIEAVVFKKRFGNTPEDMMRMYGPYEPASLFFLSVDPKEGRPVGALRVIPNSEAGLMTLNNLPADLTDLSHEEILAYHGIKSPNECWDVGTVAVLPEYREQGKGVSVQLYRAFYVSAEQAGIEHMTAILDRKPYDTMKDYLGIPISPLANLPPFSFEGSDESIAAHIDIPEYYPKMKRRSRTMKNLLARKAIGVLAFGKADDALMFDTDYKK